MKSRREALKLALLAGIGLSAPGEGQAPRTLKHETDHAASADPLRTAKGFENQRIADLGDGRYLNPIMSGDHPDPTILKDGDVYYITFSSFEAHPALVIWQSHDVINWRVLGTALTKPLGSVFAVDLCKHDGRYFIYIPIIHSSVTTTFEGMSKIFVIHADRMSGPWSDPVALDISGYIDPAHIVGEDGRRYLFLSGVSRVRLSDDGLAIDGPIEHVYDGWKYPDEWVVEAYALEGPKLLRRGKWFYLISAVGGTAGPPTGHMVIAARSLSIHGPWQNCPHNPIVRTRHASERWWSRGHATLVEGPGGDWWMVYHGFENNYRTLGRQTLLEPIEWTDDGWFHTLGGDLSKPLSKPKGGRRVPHGIAHSDDFSSSAFGTRWSVYKPGIDAMAHVRLDNGSLLLTSKGASPTDGFVLTGPVGDQAYEISVDMELSELSSGGLLLFYSGRLYCGMGHDGVKMLTYRSGDLCFWQEPAPALRRIHLKIVNDRHIANGVDWRRHGLRMETSGYNTNTADELLSLRPALFATGTGEVRFRKFTFRALS
jgi:xylan 1,4-beta-xylosidase